jgi:hypothetical protein
MNVGCFTGVEGGVYSLEEQLAKIDSTDPDDRLALCQQKQLAVL